MLVYTLLIAGLSLVGAASSGSLKHAVDKSPRLGGGSLAGIESFRSDRKRHFHGSKSEEARYLGGSGSDDSGSLDARDAEREQKERERAEKKQQELRERAEKKLKALREQAEKKQQALLEQAEKRKQAEREKAEKRQQQEEKKQQEEREKAEKKRQEEERKQQEEREKAEKKRQEEERKQQEEREKAEKRQQEEREKAEKRQQEEREKALKKQTESNAAGETVVETGSDVVDENQEETARDRLPQSRSDQDVPVDGKGEEFDFFLGVLPHSQTCKPVEFEDMDQIMTAIMRVGFQDLDVYFDDLEDPALGLQRQRNTNTNAAKKKRYGFAGHACRRCKNGKKKRRSQGTARYLLEVLDEPEDPLEYENIATRMTEATTITVVDTFASDPMSCLGRGRPPEISVQLMVPAI